MTEQVREHVRESPVEAAAPEIVVKKTGRFSIVWIIPIIAALIGAGLAYKSIAERGPTVAITFETADGIEARKTKIKFKSVEIGLVEAVNLSDDLTHVVITASLVKGAEPHLLEGTRFWVVRPRVGTTGISGLGTLISGAYIEVEPGRGEPTRTFTGLEYPPVRPVGAPGLKLTLRARDLGSLSIGSPVYYRRVLAGEVERSRLSVDRRSVEVDIFINRPFDGLVRKSTRFWNASGIDVSIGADGMSATTESLEALLAGGVAFDTPDLEGEPVKAGTVFRLYGNLRSIPEDYTERLTYVLYFDGSVRGLKVGAPVDFRGIIVGQVKDIKLVYDHAVGDLRIPVLIEIEPDRVAQVGNTGPVEDYDTGRFIQSLVARGLRAQLQTESLLTGRLFIELEFHPETQAKVVGGFGDHPELPTIPTSMEVLTGGLAKVVDTMSKLPLERLIENAASAAGGIDRVVRGLDEKIVPLASSLDGTLKQARKTLATANGLLSPDSPTQHDLATTLRELSAAARAVRALAAYLERHPEAIVYGKPK